MNERRITFSMRLIGWIILGLLFAANVFFGEMISQRFQSIGYLVLICGAFAYLIVFLIKDRLAGRDKMDTNKDLRGLARHLTDDDGKNSG
jgi:hypothetical protein